MIGWLIVDAGMAPYWYWHIMSFSGIMGEIVLVAGILTWVLPILVWVIYLFLQLAGKTPAFPFGIKRLRIATIFISWIDLIILTWIVSITGGITGSMYLPVFLAIPACLLVLKTERWDSLQVIVLLIATGFCFWFLSSLDGHAISAHANQYGQCTHPYYLWFLGFRGSDHPREFMWSSLFVNLFCILAPLVQSGILFLREENNGGASQ